MKSYRGEYIDDNDPFLHPIIAEDSLIKKMPKTLIVVGSSDPLRDDSIRYLKRFM